MVVIGVNGSPRPGGHTAALIGEVLAGAAAEGASTRLFQLGTMDLSFCDGCRACKADAKCVIQDDMQAFYEAVEAPGPKALVVGTPIYYNHVTAQLKAWIDRLCPYYMTRLGGRMFPRGVRAVVLATWEWDREDAYDSVLDWLADRLTEYHDIEVVAQLRMPGSGVRPLPERPDLVAAARAAGAGLAAEMGRQEQ